MGAGKSTVGRALAEKLEVPFLDADALIERRTGRTIPEIFEEDGEAGFRQIEEDVILEQLGPEGVFSLGGGAVNSSAVRKALREHFVVWLSISLDEALLRVGDDGERPMLADPELGRIYASRHPLYQEVSDIVVDVNHASSEDISETLAECLERVEVAA
jgi:shikimate kinase